MACSIRPRNEILQEIEEWKAKLIDAKETLDAINATANELNSFDDSEGRASLRKRKILDQMDYIDRIDQKIKELNNELCGRKTRVTHYNRRSIGGGGIHL